MLQKQALNINFSQGLDTKSDPFQVAPGKFLSLENSIFDKTGLLKKRNGYAALPSLPDTTSNYLTTFNGNLTAIGSSLTAYSSPSGSYFNKGAIVPVDVNVVPMIRDSKNQSQVDSAIAPNGSICVVYTDLVPSGGSTTPSYKYSVIDPSTGQNIIQPTVIPVSTGVVTGSPRVFALGNYFIILFTNLITAVNHLQYIAINSANPSQVVANTDIAASYVPATTLSFDGVVYDNQLYIAYNTLSGGQSIRITALTSSLTLFAAKTFATEICTMMSLCVDSTNTTAPIIYASYYNLGTTTGKVFAVDKNLNTVLSPTTVVSTGTILNVTCSAISGSVTTFYEYDNNYSYNAAIPSHYVSKISVTQGGTVGSLTVVSRSVGLASKAFIYNSVSYFLAAYQSTYQPTYFLMDSSGNLVSKISYSNGGGYLTVGLPSVSLSDNVASVCHLFKDLITSVNKNTNIPVGSQVNGIYSQLGINLASFEIGSVLVSSEIGSNLNISGGFLWSYDGFQPVEQNFHLFPDSIEASWSTTGGSIAAQPDGATNTNAYFYQVIYSWTDGQGNAFRSAPSIPISVTTTGSGTTGSITVNVPTLRLTYKSNVKVEVYRWSVAQQAYYQVTSVAIPTLSSKTVDSIAFVDTLSDASILGNSLLYTTGGVVENIGPPATSVITLFQSRLWLVDSEDRNLLWFSKQVIDQTPVEMSDLLTIYVAPTTSAQGSTGPITALAALDDKLIIFKRNAIYYITGVGPDSTGANNQYSDPVFITSTVGCENQNSIVFMPNGLMFQSDKGIWLLGRNLATEYIGAPVESFNSSLVQSAVNVPGTNQVRFTLDSGTTLMFDYYFGQWGTFTNVPAISSTLFQGYHTYINSSGQVFQESPGAYLDGSNPVLMSFTTSWINLAGLQGYKRIYNFYLLGSYISPHKLQVQVGYDYAASPSQLSIISPDNFNYNYGTDSPYGQGSPYGGRGSLEQWQVGTRQQLCESFQITVNEIFNPFFGTIAGAGLTMSGINCVVGLKKGYRPIAPINSVG
jgi:hypothetical protein